MKNTDVLWFVYMSLAIGIYGSGIMAWVSHGETRPGMLAAAIGFQILAKLETLQVKDEDE